VGAPTPISLPASPSAADAQPLHDRSSSASSTGGFIKLSSLPRFLTDPVTGKRPSPPSVYRWAAKGCRGHRLRTVRLPSGLVTTFAWIDEWIAALTGDGHQPNGPVTLARRRREQLAARQHAARIIDGRMAEKTGGPL
jgi:hypothetical protein